MESFDGIRNTTRWLVLYGGPGDDDDDFHFWGAMQTEQEANWEAYKREQLGWKTRIIPPTPEVYEPLPTYAECCSRVQEGTATALHWFIYDYEPTTVDGETEWRRKLATLVRQSGGIPATFPDELKQRTRDFRDVS